MPSSIYGRFYVYYDADNDDIPETDISAGVVTDISGDYGDFSPSVSDFLADPGTVSFELKNEDEAYSTLAIGRRVDIRVSDGVRTKNVFSGKISPATMDSGEWGERRVHVVLNDWMQKAGGANIENLAIAQDITSDVAMDLLLGSSSNLPAAREFADGVEQMPYVFDGLGKNSKVYSEMDRIAKSELAPCYLRFRDTPDREKLVMENQFSRGALTPLSQIPINDADAGKLKHRGGGSPGFLKHRGGGSPGFLKISETTDAYLDRLQIDSEWHRGDYIVNKFTATDVTRTISATPQVLYILEDGSQSRPLGTLEFATFSGQYTDPNDRGTTINARDVQTPVGVTDYTFNELENGSGISLTHNILVMSFTYSANRWTATVVNLGQPAYCTKWQIRGYGIAKHSNLEYITRNLESIQEVVKEEREETLKREYSVNGRTTKTFADRAVILNRMAQNSPRLFSFIASTESLMKAFMYLDIGSKVRIIESRPAKDGYFYIKGIKFNLALGGTVSFSWYVQEAIETQCQPIAVRASTIDTGSRVAIDFGVLSYLANMANFSYSMWVKTSDATPYGPLLSRAVDLGTGRRGNYLFIWFTDIIFNSKKTPTDGWWTAEDAITTQNTWHHVVVTYDNTTDTADPVIYINGVAQTLTEVSAPSGPSDDDSDCPVVLFNFTPAPDAADRKYYYSGVNNFTLKDVRIYNRILSQADVDALYAGEDDYTTVPSGLLFQGVYAPKANIDDYINHTIENDDGVLDVVRGAAGIPYNEDSTTSAMMLNGLDLT